MLYAQYFGIDCFSTTSHFIHAILNSISSCPEAQWTDVGPLGRSSSTPLPSASIKMAAKRRPDQVIACPNATILEREFCVARASLPI